MSDNKPPILYPVFFAKHDGEFTNQMTAFANEFARQVGGGEPSETYINAVYLPSDAFSFADMVMSAKDALLSVTELAGNIVARFPSFAGDAAAVAGDLSEFWLENVGNLPEYASLAADKTEELLSNFPVIASDVWRISGNLASWSADMLENAANFVAATFDDFPGTFPGTPEDFWEFVIGLPYPGFTPTLLPLLKPEEPVNVPIMSPEGNAININLCEAGNIPGLNSNLWGTFGGFLPNSPDMVCLGMATIHVHHDSRTLADGSLENIVDTREFLPSYLGTGNPYPGFFANCVGRNVFSGGLVTFDPFHFGDWGHTAWPSKGFSTEASCGYTIDQSKTMSNTFVITSGGSNRFYVYPQLRQFFPEEWNINYHYPIIEREEYTPMVNHYETFYLNHTYLPVLRVKASDFFGFPRYVWPSTPPFPGMMPFSPLVMTGLFLGGIGMQNTTVIASLLLSSQSAGRRELRKAKT